MMWNLFNQRNRKQMRFRFTVVLQCESDWVTPMNRPVVDPNLWFDHSHRFIDVAYITARTLSEAQRIWKHTLSTEWNNLSTPLPGYPESWCYNLAGGRVEMFFNRTTINIQERGNLRTIPPVIYRKPLPALRPGDILQVGKWRPVMIDKRQYFWHLWRPRYFILYRRGHTPFLRDLRGIPWWEIGRYTPRTFLDWSI